MCESHRCFAPLLSRTLRHIPQALSTVATGIRAQYVCNNVLMKVSIPQAVNTVATFIQISEIQNVTSFQYRKR